MFNIGETFSNDDIENGFKELILANSSSSSKDSNAKGVLPNTFTVDEFIEDILGLQPVV